MNMFKFMKSRRSLAARTARVESEPRHCSTCGRTLTGSPRQGEPCSAYCDLEPIIQG